MNDLKNSTMKSFSIDYYPSTTSLSNLTTLQQRTPYPSDLHHPSPSSTSESSHQLQALLILSSCFLQCMFLHPTFAKSKSTRFFRKAVAPITVTWLITYPFRHPKLPLENHARENLALAMNCIYFTFKSIEWASLSRPVYDRVLSDVKGVKIWLKSDLSPEVRREQEEAKWSLLELIGWTIKHISSLRGLEFDWGPQMVARKHSTWSLLLRIYKVRLVCLCAITFIVATRDSITRKPITVLRSIGIPEFYGLEFISESLLTMSMGIFLSGSMDIIYNSIIISTTFLHKILSSISFIKPSIIDFFDPTHYPLMFESPHLSENLAYFWGRGWHSLLKRIFVFNGGKPATSIVQHFGGSSKLQKLAGLFGVFFISACLHEYIIWVVAQEPHSHPHQIFKSIPGSGIFFILQTFGILIEPFLIPLIPKSLGGGKLWVWSFLTLTAKVFREQYFSPDRLDSLFLPLSDWSLKDLLIPFT